MNSEKSEIDENNFNKFQDEKQVGEEKKVVQQQQQSPTTTTISENKKSRILMSSLQNVSDNDAVLLMKSKIGDTTKKMHRRVSFPAQTLVTGYLEASNPFAEIRTWTSKELVDIYVESCKQHEATPIESVLAYLGDLEVFEALCRSAVLNLRDQQLSTNDCEALEAILKRVQFRIIDLNNCGLDDASACSIFDMIEYYEATNELDVSYNPKITIRGWQSMVSMIKKSHALNILSVRGFPISISMAANLGQALMVSFIHTLKLEHCGLAGRPIANLCTSLRNNTVLKELWLAHNDLTVYDSYQIGIMLQNNHYLQLLDISNNNIMDEGASYITSALIQQSIDFQQLPKSTSCSSLLNISDLSASLNNINNSSARYSPIPKHRSDDIVSLKNSNNLISIDHHKADNTTEKPIFVETPTIIQPPPSSQPPTIINNEKNDVIIKNVENLISNLIVVDDDDLNTKDFSIEHNDSITKNTINFLQQRHQQQKVQPEVEQPQQQDNENNLIIITSSVQAKEIPLLEESAIGSVTINSCTTNNSSVLFKNNENNLICCDIDKCTNSKKTNMNDDNDDVINNHDANDVNDDCVNNLNANVINNNNLSNNSNDSDSNNDNKLCDNADLLLIKEEEESNSREVIDSNNQVADKAVEAVERKNEDVLKNCSEDPSTITPDATIIKNIHVAEEVLKIFETTEVEVVSELPKIEETPNNNCVPTVDVTEPKRQSEPILINNNSNEQQSQSLKLTTIIVQPEVGSKTMMSQSLDESSDDFNRAFLDQHQYPERSFSSESLNSEASVDSNDSKSSIKLAATKFSKYGTLERQTSAQVATNPSDANEDTPQKSGLQVLVLWNNGITRSAARSFADLFAQTTILEIINVGRNNLSNEFLANVKESLKTNQSLTNLGVQSAHLTCDGAKILSDTLDFGGNSTLQRIDLRDNNIKTTGLGAINDAMKSNKTVTRIDLDDVPRCRFTDDALELNNEYTRLLNSIRAQCSRNENPPERPEPISSSATTTSTAEELSPSAQLRSLRARHNASRKISLTCHNSVRQTGINNNNTTNNTLLLNSDRNSISTIRASSPEVFSKQQAHQLLDPLKKSSSTPLRSPLPSPIHSPMSSPVRSPSGSRFRVVKVKEASSPGATSLPSRSPTSTGSSPIFFPKSRFRVVTVSEPNLFKNTSQLSSSFCTSSLVAPPLVAYTPTSTLNKHSQSFSSLLIDGDNDLNKSTNITQTTDNNHKIIVTPNIVSDIPTTTIEPPTPPLDTSSVVLPAIEKSSSSSSSNSDSSSDNPNYIECIIRDKQKPLEPVIVPKETRQSDIVHQQQSHTITNLINLPILSTSFDSPETDLEVKKYMDLDSCSSISSSTESINNHNHHHHHHRHINNEYFCNTSVSSIDSYDYITTDKLSRHQQQEQNNLSKQQQQQQQQGTTPNIYKINDSFDTASMSDESLSGIISMNVLSSSPHLSSNEGTLTNSPCLDVTKPITSPDEPTAKSVKPPKPEKRVRKTSWIANTISIGGSNAGGNAKNLENSSSSGYPATLDKLISLFQHPGSLFTRSSPDMTRKDDATVNLQQQPSRKDSPMGGLFSWATTHSSGCKKEAIDNTSEAENNKLVVKEKAVASSILQPNVSPDNSIQENLALPTATPIENLPKDLQREVKENISPENTITASCMANILHRPLGNLENVVPLKEKVIFELGDDDDSSSATDVNEPIEEVVEGKLILRQSFEKSSSDTLVTVGGLGQTARDSMNVLTAHVRKEKLQESQNSVDTLYEQEDKANVPASVSDLAQPSTQ